LIQKKTGLRLTRMTVAGSAKIILYPGSKAYFSRLITRASYETLRTFLTKCALVSVLDLDNSCRFRLQTLTVTRGNRWLPMLALILRSRHKTEMHTYSHASTKLLLISLYTMSKHFIPKKSALTSDWTIKHTSCA